MPKFQIVIDAEVEPQDEFLIESVPGIISFRFDGTAVHIGEITISKENEEL
jgi:hypothetical protein